MIPMQYTKWTRREILVVLLMAITLGNSGCGLPVQWQKMASKLPEATPEDPVHYILCIWQPSEGHDRDGNHTRGFAGQICFFTRRSETPVRVNGDVRITVYDDHGQPEDRGKPLHNWDFIGDAWKIHLHNGTFGPTYSVFIPYSRKGNHQAQCALRVRYQPAEGPPIYSDTCAVILPGVLRKKEAESAADKPQGDPRTSLKSLTIPLKEKQKKLFSDLPVGESQMERVVAPASELARRAALHGMNRSAPNGTTVNDAAPPQSPALPSLPSPPPQTLPTPVMPARPLNQEQEPPKPSDFSHRKTEIGFRSPPPGELSPSQTAQPAQGQQPAQSAPFVQPAATRHPLGDFGAAQPIQPGT